MAITLAKLCENAEQNYHLKLIAGKSGLDAPVRWVHMVEDREVPDFLHGSELVFTTGIGHLGQPERLLDFVRGLKQHKGAGVVMNLGPYIREIPQDVIDYCDRVHLPLFTLPWEVHIIDITYDFCRRIIENEKAEVSTVEALKALMAHPERVEEYAPVCEKAGFEAGSPLRVVLLEFRQDGRDVTEALEHTQRMKLWRLLTRSARAAAMFLLNGRLAVIRQPCSDAQVQRMAAGLAHNSEAARLTFSMGVSPLRVGFADLSRLTGEARAALITAREQGAPLMRYADIGMNQLILGVGDRRVLENYADSYLRALIAYDEANHTDYTETLYAYLTNSSSVKAVAEQSGVHRNTVNYKIKQIRDVLGVELTDSQKAELLLAFRIRALLNYMD